MTDHRKRYDGTFKAKVVLESLKNEKTIAELASDYGVHPNQITQWRKQVLEDLPALFSSKQARNDKAQEEEKDELLEANRPAQGRGGVAQKKVGDSPLSEKRGLVDMNHKVIPITR